VRIAALLISDLERDKTCADSSSDAKCFILYFKKGKHLYVMFRLRYFTIKCQ